jgi:hypothetical protein
MFEGGPVLELFAANGERVATTKGQSVTIAPPPGTVPSPTQCGIAALGNYLFIANGNPGTVSLYTSDGVLVNPNFIVTNPSAGIYSVPIAALYVAPGAM